MLLDFNGEEKRLEKELHWATESDSRVGSEMKKALRRQDERKKNLESILHNLQTRREHLLGIIAGSIRPSAVDLPDMEADDFRTRLRLRMKGVRGIAIEKAKEEIVPLEEEIEKTEKAIQRVQDKVKPIEKRKAEGVKAFSELVKSIREQRSTLRHASSTSGEISDMTNLFGWYNPYLLARKGLEEVMIAGHKLDQQIFSLKRREEEIADLDKQIEGMKKELKAPLGEAYDVSLMPIVFKDGRSPRGKRFLKNELTVDDVESLDLPNKISHPKTLKRKADRFSSVLWNHRNFILESLLQIGHLCQLRVYYLRLLAMTRNDEKVVRESLDVKIQILHRIIKAAENCGKLAELISTYMEKKEEGIRKKEHATGILERVRSNL